MNPHSHPIPTHTHGALAHNHGGTWHHDHDSATATHTHDPWDMIGQAQGHDHGPATTCGHLGGDTAADAGVVRVLIQHRGRGWLLCGACGASFDWQAVDAALDAEGTAG